MGGGEVESTHLFFKLVKTTEKVNIWENFLCMVKYSQFSAYTWVYECLVFPKPYPQTPFTVYSFGYFFKRWVDSTSPPLELRLIDDFKKIHFLETPHGIWPPICPREYTRAPGKSMYFLKCNFSIVFYLLISMLNAFFIY